jgi:Fe-S cluster biogenesis protein NfuA
MFIQTEKTPNPATIKFLPGQAVMTRGVAEFTDEAAAGSSPLAQRLFTLDGVEAVFLGSDFVSITKADGVRWDDLKARVLASLMEHFTLGLPVMADGAGAGAASDHADQDDEVTRQIKELLDTRVRPAVAQDGGDVVFVRFEDGVVYLRMRGACSGCPSASATLKHGIENMLRHYVPEVLEVRPADEAA